MATMRSRSAPRAGVLAAALAAACVTGCSDDVPRADVRGTVTFRGKPVVSGSVLLIASDQLPYYGTIQPDGTYTARQVPVGPAQLAVNSPDPYFQRPLTPEQQADMDARQKMSGLEPAVKPPKGAWFAIPRRYGDPRTAGLNGTVEQPLAAIDCRLD